MDGSVKIWNSTVALGVRLQTRLTHARANSEMRFRHVGLMSKVTVVIEYKLGEFIFTREVEEFEM